MKFFYFIVLTCITLLIGCKTNPPQGTEPVITVYGQVYISSSITGAQIYVDNQNTNQFTPDTITISVGSHTIRLEKEGYVSYSENVVVTENALTSVNATLLVLNAQKMVLLEDFANVSCDPCVVSNRIIESLSNVYFGKFKLAVVKFPTNWPKPNDPFYIANTVDAQSRFNGVYHITNAPTIVIDGILQPTPTDSNDVKTKINARLAIPAKFKIDVYDSLAGSNYTIKVKVIVYDTAGLNIQNLVLQTIVTETDIEFATPPGSNGETKFYNVMRKMLPTNAGETLGSIAPGTVLNFERELILNSSWIKPNINVVAFIQDKNSKEVFQAGRNFRIPIEL